MASYDAKIQVILSGLRELSLLEDRLEKIGGIIDTLNKTPVALNVGGRGEERDLSGRLSKGVNDYVRAWVNGNKEIGKSVNAVQQQAANFQELLRETAMVQQDSAQKNAIENLATAWADTTRAAERYDKKLNDIQRKALGLQPQAVRDYEVARRENLLQSRRVRQENEEAAGQEVKNLNATVLNNINKISTFFAEAASAAVSVKATALNTKANWNDFFATAAQYAVNVKANAINTKTSWNDFFATAAQYAVNVKANSLNTKAKWNDFFATAAQYAVNVKATALNTKANWNNFFTTAAQYAVNVKANALNTKTSWSNFFDTAAQYAVNVKAKALNTKANWSNFFDTAAQYAVNVKAKALNTKTSWIKFFSDAAKLAQDLSDQTTTSKTKSKGSKVDGGFGGRLTFNANPTQENLALGAGFPLLFGGGVGQVAGGLIGSLFGGGFGGQILGAALGQQLTDAFVRITDIGKALNTLSMDTLRDSVITVNSALDYQVSVLIQAGRAEEARALAARAVFEQTGLTAGAVERATDTSNQLKNAWDGVVGALSGTVSILLDALAPTFIGVLRTVETLFRGINAIVTVIGDAGEAAGRWVAELVFGKDIADQIYKFLKGTNEEEEKLAAELARSVDAQKRGLELSKKLLEIDKTRTNDTSTRGKLINIEADKQEKLARILFDFDEKRRTIQEKYGAVRTAEGKKLLAQSLALNEAEKNIAIESANVTAERQKQLTLTKQVADTDRSTVIALREQQNAIASQVSTWAAVGSIVSARIGAEQQLNDLQKVRLEREYESAATAGTRQRIATELFRVEAVSAQLEYQNSLASIALEEEKLKLQLYATQLKGYEIIAEGKLQILKANSVEEENKKREQTEDAVRAQNQLIQGLGVQVASQRVIGKYQAEGAKLAYLTKVETAGTALQQKLASDAIGLSASDADSLAGSMINAYTNADSLKGITDGLAVKLNDAAVAVTEGAKEINYLSTEALGAANSTDAWRQAILDKEEATNKAFQAEYTAIQNNLKEKEAAYAAAVAAAKNGDSEILLSAQTRNAGIAFSTSSVFTDIQTLWSQFASFFDTNVGQPTQGVWGRLMQFFRTSTEISVGGILGYLEFSFKTFEAIAYNTLVLPWKMLWNYVLREPVVAMLQWLQTSWNAFAGFITSNVVTPVQKRWNVLMQGITEKTAGVSNRIKEIWAGIVTFFNNNLVRPIQSAWNTLMQALPNALKSVANFARSIFDGIANGIKNAFRSALQFVANIINGLGGLVNRLIDGVNAVAAKVGGKQLPRVPVFTIPQFAEGGVVNKPTLAMVGEGGEPEYIIPQSKMATAASNYLSGGRGAGIMEGGGGDGAVINIQTGPVMEMNGERYVTMGDFERGLRQVAGSVYKGLRTPAGRYATGVR